MDKKIVFIFSFVLMTSYANLAFAAEAATAAPAVTQPSPIQSIHQLVESGQYLEARTGYEALLKDSSLSAAELASVKVHYGDLNMQLLFSRIATPESQFHVVVSGDALYKIAKKYKTTVGLIKKSNGLSSDVIHPGMKLKVVPSDFRILIDKSENWLEIYLADRFLKRYSVATGKDNNTPIGTFKIINKLENPTWYKAGAVYPPDSPDNLLGTRWLGFDYPGYGIHGTVEPESIGSQASEGCVRMLNEEVEELYSFIPAGTEVVIRN